jgi:hypothetical protein
VLEAGGSGVAGEVGGGEGVDVHDLLELVLLAPGAGPVAVHRPRPCADERAPQRRNRVGAPLRPGRDAVAVVGGLPAERHDAARSQYAPELAKGQVEVGQVVEHGVAEDEVERVVLEGEVRGLAGRRLDREPQLGRGALEAPQHSRRDVRGHRLAHHSGAQQVEREVAGTGSDFERALVVPWLVPERLAQLAGDLRLADLAVVDAPLRVVVLGREVVVADVGVPDAVGRLHGRAEPST